LHLRLRIELVCVADDRLRHGIEDRRQSDRGVGLWMLLVIGVVTAFVTVLLTDLTDGWSWILGPLTGIGIVVINDLRKSARVKMIMLDAIKLVVILMIVFPIALAAVIFAVWAL
jgi:hypothetical protein